jgi:alkylhydroperoxidase family enzyme
MSSVTRIEPLQETSAPAAVRDIAAAHVATGSRMTNMKWTLAHAPTALAALLQWYPLHDEVVPFLGERRTILFCHAISTDRDCLVCSAYFRRLLIDAGEDPGALELDETDELVVAYGRRLASTPNTVDKALWERLAGRFSDKQIVLLTAFGAVMVATNVFNDALEVPLDSYLLPYRDPVA